MYFITINESNISRGDLTDSKYWIAAHTEVEAIEKAAKKFGVTKEKINVKQGFLKLYSLKRSFFSLRKY